MSRVGVATLIFVALVGVLIWYSMAGVTEVTCEVCITFKEQTECRTGRGRTREDAMRTATESACAVMPTANMAERVLCSKTEPTSVSCQ